MNLSAHPLSYRLKAHGYEVGRRIKHAWPEIVGAVLGALFAWRCS